MRRLPDAVRALYRARHTVRARLAMLYSGVFFVSGLVLLAIPAGFVRVGSTSQAAAVPANGAPSSPGDVIATSQHSTDLHYLVVGSVVALAVLVVVSAILGWVLAGRALRPLRTITETARDISASNLHRRLALAGPDDEFKELGETLDELFARLEGSFDSQRRFVANASHELRTPLTAERTVLQVALADPGVDVGTLRAACEKVLALGEQQERLIDALLTLAATERGLERREPCELADLAASVLARRRSEIDAHALQVEATFASAPVAGDRRLLESLVNNVVDNAIRHNRSGGRIQIAISTVDGHARLSLANTGADIPAEDLSRLFQPFQRLAADRTRSVEGHGLGLAIVQAIVDAHGATLHAIPRPEGGLEVTIDFATGHPDVALRQRYP